MASAIQQCKSAIIISLLSLFPLLPLHSSKSSQSTWLHSLCYTVTYHQLSILHMQYIYVYATFSIRPTLSFPGWVHKTVLYSCLFIPSQQIGSSVLFFQIHIYVLIWNTCFSFSDLLHFVQQVLGSSTSLELTQICFLFVCFFSNG